MSERKNNNVVEDLLVSHASYCIRYPDVFLSRLFRDCAAGNADVGPNDTDCFPAEVFLISR